MVGAVVGVQPFGGEGLSGTGPKAGGRCTCTACCRKRRRTCWRACWRRRTDVKTPPPRCAPCAVGQARTPSRWWSASRRFAAQVAQRRRRETCRPDRRAQRLQPGAAAGRAVPGGQRAGPAGAARRGAGGGSRAIWPASAQLLLHRLPAEVQARVALASDWSAPSVAFDAVLLHGDVEHWPACAAAGARPGPIVGVNGWPRARTMSARAAGGGALAQRQHRRGRGAMRR
jgi:RHH-type proline utilization regulon transcriptional repressor/proline dehydrogenase/delta 1-pyrroline-5-carboxylate dehydrogenase